MNDQRRKATPQKEYMSLPIITETATLLLKLLPNIANNTAQMHCLPIQM